MDKLSFSYFIDELTIADIPTTMLAEDDAITWRPRIQFIDFEETDMPPNVDPPTGGISM